MRPPRSRKSRTHGVTRFLAWVSRFWPVSVPLVLALHMVFGAEAQPMALRVGTAIPGMLILLEGRRILWQRAPGELPFVFVGLVQYYIWLGLPVFTDRPFFDLRGPVPLTEQSRIYAGLAIGGGALLVVAARYLIGAPFAGTIQRALLTLLPRSTPGKSIHWALGLYLAAIAFLSAALVTDTLVVPAALIMPIYVMASFPLALGLWFALAPVMPTTVAKRGLWITVGLGSLNGLVAGFLQPMFRIGLAFVGGLWATSRKAPVSFVIAIIALYFLLNPVKFLYRQAFWFGERQEVGYLERVQGIGEATSEYLSGDNEGREGDLEAALLRVSEMNQVVFVFQAVPRRTPFLDGEGWLALLVGWVPRIVWPDKPDYRNVTQTYRYKVGITPETSRSSFVLPLHVDGYWNLGWIGIGLACLLLGAYLGVAERVFTAKHWGLTAMGIAHLAELAAYVNIGRVYMSLFQLLVGHLVVIWAVHVLSLFSGRRRAR